MESRTKKDQIFIDKFIENTILPSLIISLLESGELKKSELNDKSKVWRLLSNLLNDELRFIGSIDYRQNILLHAESFKKLKEFDFYFMLIATFFEHTINHVINLECTKRKISPKEQKDILKIGIVGKFTWLLTLLELQPINSKHLDIILKVSERRNAFVHYKWPYEDLDKRQLENEKNTDEQLMIEAKKTIAYIKGYDTKYEHKGQKGKIDKLFKKKKK